MRVGRLTRQAAGAVPWFRLVIHIMPAWKQYSYELRLSKWALTIERWGGA